MSISSFIRGSSPTQIHFFIILRANHFTSLFFITSARVKMYFLCVKKMFCHLFYVFLLSLSTFSYAEVVATTNSTSSTSKPQITPFGGKGIDVIVVIDTDSVMKAYPHPSKNPDAPTPITHDYGYMITAKALVNSGQGTADLSFKGITGDFLRWYGTSESANIFTKVILYKMKHNSESMSETRIQSFRQKVLVPKSTSITDLEIVQYNFIGLEATARGEGKVNYDVYFGLYDRDGENKPKLFGYFTWDPVVTIL